MDPPHADANSHIPGRPSRHLRDREPSLHNPGSPCRPAFQGASRWKDQVSLRSKGKIDVHRVATQYGGGGHQNASGAVLEGPLEAAVQRVVADAEALFR